MAMPWQIEDCLFNYDAVKMAYNTRVNNCLKTKKAGLWTRNKVRESILRIRTYRQKQKSGLPCLPVTIEGTEVDIATENGVEILILVKDKKIIEVLPCEDCFDVFVDLHLRQSHAGYARMSEVLQTYFYFSSVHLECFVLSCNVCIQQRGEDINMLQASDKDLENKQCNLLVHITFLDVIDVTRSVNVNENFGFTYMLVYKEMASGYILLRPLKKLDPEEVALELYNIFTDFGPPETIETTHIDFLIVVMDLLKETPIKYYCTISDNQSDNETLRCEITENINEWMET
ncbi:jg19984 [Pararge aegeria aegeria]|uniref:Jg19984 protein n=1 Tax=Pararge aegeria aegeria TaxID=348720 RepID=A0A8S4R5J4_9NEOP|nr:jg19984 [Pararge aegeria aegeria]